MDRSCINCKHYHKDEVALFGICTYFDAGVDIRIEDFVKCSMHILKED